MKVESGMLINGSYQMIMILIYDSIAVCARRKRNLRGQVDMSEFFTYDQQNFPIRNQAIDSKQVISQA